MGFQRPLPVCRPSHTWHTVQETDRLETTAQRRHLAHELRNNIGELMLDTFMFIHSFKQN